MDIKERDELGTTLVIHAIKEMLYSYKKNGGDVDYCALTIYSDVCKQVIPLIRADMQGEIAIELERISWLEGNDQIYQMSDLVETLKSGTFKEGGIDEAKVT